MNNHVNVEFDGIVCPGLGTGAGFVTMPHFFNRFVTFLGVAPFPGTLNIQLSRESLPIFRTAIGARNPMVIPARRVGGQNLWRVSCYWISLWRADRGSEYNRERGLALQFDNPTHPQDIVEVVSSVHLRKRFGLVDGDRLCFVFAIGSR